MFEVVTLIQTFVQFWCRKLSRLLSHNTNFEVLRISVVPLDKKKAAWWGKKSDILWLEPGIHVHFPHKNMWISRRNSRTAEAKPKELFYFRYLWLDGQGTFSTDKHPCTPFILGGDANTFSPLWNTYMLSWHSSGVSEKCPLMNDIVSHCVQLFCHIWIHCEYITSWKDLRPWLSNPKKC